MAPTFNFLVPAEDRAVLSWKNVSVTVPVKGAEQRKRILDDLSGQIRPGEVLAIMGPSGCGKSTLLDTLSGRIHSVDVEGSILVNGRAMSLAFGTAAYVPQDDVLIGTLTVRETLMYSARLRLPPKTPRGDIEATVDAIIKDLGLEVCTNVPIGNWHMRGISGGQKRRVSIGVELVTSPRIIFLDEPTSGLDSASSYYVMLAVRRLAHEGRTVCSTIHQPSSEVFNLFDSLLLLSAGTPVFMGKSRDALSFFASAGFPCPSHSSAADHFLMTINQDFQEVEASMSVTELKEVADLEQGADVVDAVHGKVDIKANVQRLSALLIGSENYKAMLQSIGEQQANPTHVFIKNREPGLVRASAILFQRAVVNVMRNYGYVWLRLAMYVMLCICLGTIYIHLGNKYSDVYNRYAILFFVVAFLTFMAIAAVPAMIDDIRIFLRERYNGWYGVGSFVVSNTMTSLPFLYLVAIVSTLCCYWIAGLRETATAFFRFTGILFMALSVTESMFMLIVGIVPNFLLAMGLGAGVMGLYMLLCGFFIRELDIPGPVWRYPLHYIAMHTYAYEALMNNEFRAEHGRQRIFQCPCESQPGGCGSPCVYTGEDILAFNGIRNRSYGFNIGILTLMLGGYRLLLIGVLKLQERRRKASGPRARESESDQVATIAIKPAGPAVPTPCLTASTYT